MKKVKIRNYNKGYKKYSEQFNAEKKIGNIRRDTRKLTKKQYNTVRTVDKISNKEILEKQTILKSKQMKRKAWSDYKKVRSNINAGDKAIYDETYWGRNHKNVEGLGYHTNLSGLLHSKNGIHFLITNRLIAGEDKGTILADYGY